MPELILRSGKRAGRRVTLPAGDVIIGRDEGCHIRLTSSDVSRQHCRLRCDRDNAVVADLGSRNGTFINETRVNAPTMLKPGDLLRIGPFLFQSPPGAEAEQNLDSEITGWLTVEGSVAGGPPVGTKNETTLVPKVDDQDSVRDDAESPSSDNSPTQLASRNQREDCVNQHDPVIQQASDVIRAYWATKKSSAR